MRYLLIALTIGTALWLVTTLPAEYVRLKNQSVIDAIQQQEVVSERRVEAAIGNYQLVSAFNFCHRSFYKDFAALLMMRYAKQNDKSNLAKMDEALTAAQKSISRHLECQPKDGNGWLNKAIISIQQAGFSSDTLMDYKRSARFSPREAWLAEKRSQFALKFFPLFDKEARMIAMEDIHVLKTASTNRRRVFRQKLKVDSLDDIITQMNRISATLSP